MHLDANLLQQLAQLSRIDVQPQEEAALLEDLEAILTWTDQLNTVDTQGVEPLMTMSHEQNVFSQDIPLTPLRQESALANAPQLEGVYFAVPSIK